WRGYACDARFLSADAARRVRTSGRTRPPDRKVRVNSYRRLLGGNSWLQQPKNTHQQGPLLKPNSRSLPISRAARNSGSSARPMAVLLCAGRVWGSGAGAGPGGAGGGTVGRCGGAAGADRFAPLAQREGRAGAGGRRGAEGAGQEGVHGGLGARAADDDGAG